MLEFVVILAVVSLAVAINVGAWLWMPVNIAAAQELGWFDRWPAVAINAIFVITVLIWFFKRKFEHRLFYAGWLLCSSGLVGVVASIEQVSLRWREGFPEFDLRFSDGLSICSIIVGAILMVSDSAFAFAKGRQPTQSPKDAATGGIIPGLTMGDLWQGFKATRTRTVATAVLVVVFVGLTVVGMAKFASAGTSREAEFKLRDATPTNNPSIRRVGGLRYSSKDAGVLTDKQRPVWHDEGEDHGRELFPRTYAWHFVKDKPAEYQVGFEVTTPGALERFWIIALKVENELVYLPADTVQVSVIDKSGRVFKQVSVSRKLDAITRQSFDWADAKDGQVVQWQFELAPIVVLEGQTVRVSVFSPQVDSKGIVALGEVTFEEPPKDE